MNPLNPQRRQAAALVWALGLVAWVGLTAWPVGAQNVPPAQSEVVDLAQARAEHQSGAAVLVDIREPSEHATGVADGAQLLPMRQLANRLSELPRDRPVLLICNTQNRSRATLQALRERGYTNLRYVHGGMSEWVKRGWPTVKPGG